MTNVPQAERMQKRAIRPANHHPLGRIMKCAILPKTAMPNAACDYARRSLLVLPVWGVRRDGTCACGQAGCSSPGKHPIGVLVPRGVHDATLDPGRITGW